MGASRLESGPAYYFLQLAKQRIMRTPTGELALVMVPILDASTRLPASIMPACITRTQGSILAGPAGAMLVADDTQCETRQRALWSQVFITSTRQEAHFVIASQVSSWMEGVGTPEVRCSDPTASNTR